MGNALPANKAGSTNDQFVEVMAPHKALTQQFLKLNEDLYLSGLLDAQASGSH